MPAMLDDPDSPTIWRTQGAKPLPDPHDPNPLLPADVLPRQVTLRDRVTVATIVPFPSAHQVPPSLLAYLSDQFNKEIEGGDTYPMLEGMPVEKYGKYWFQNFAAIMLMGSITSADEVVEGKNWATECLGSFYIKPNYPGRSSHICNAGFLVTDAARNKGVGRLMGEAYLDYAPKLGYSYSVFNLVYETNVASCRIWDALGFKRIGKVKGCGNLKSYPGQLIDAIIYGRDLGKDDGEEFVSEERFDKIKFYLRTGKYPAGADRAEKSRLRSAATHYKLIPTSPNPDGIDDGDGIGEKLMLKDKEVISDPKRQYEIARQTHVHSHGGINKTTAIIAERFHWVRIKETVSLVIKNCAECKEVGKSTGTGQAQAQPLPTQSPTTALPISGHHKNDHVLMSNTSPTFSPETPLSQHQLVEDDSYPHHGQQSVSPQVLNRTLPHSSEPQHHLTHQSPLHHAHHSHHTAHHHQQQHQLQHQQLRDHYMPLDPQIMEDVHLPHHIVNYSHHQVHVASPPGHEDHYEAAQDGDAGYGLGMLAEHASHENDDRDLDMLIDQDDEDEEASEIVELDGGIGEGVRDKDHAWETGGRGFGAG
ncbi:hypothetical protein BP5796_07351 [Coleophoma crateriformis]|uniref:N-acetyltransferase domain-containing protein n=1 Tax=Coleophoma crateriformis TaxID=565419 RepID=A0A3D8RIN1_9HELO|nr:hypothetical protein BP5796_07351 [Coleophoma crateriformis]